MKLTFNVNYRTRWGESLYISGSHPALGMDVPGKAVRMNLFGEEHWSLTIEVDDDTPPFTYSYIVRDENGSERREWGAPHRFLPPVGAGVCEMFDAWQDMPADKPFYSMAFTECINARQHRDELLSPAAGFLTLRVEAPAIRPDEALAICGSCEALGAWSTAHAVRLNDALFPTWTVNLPLASIEQPCDYKFIVVEKASGALVRWEEGRNRRLNYPAPAAAEAVVVSGLRFVNPEGHWRGAGTAIPVFSLRSDEDMGIGDFLDLMQMVDWAAKTGQNMIQLLPINDTTMTRTWTDSYPYNANSTFALHPILARVTAIGTLENAERREYFEALSRELNSLKEVDYERVLQAKEAYCRELFAQEGEKTLESDDFKSYFADNSHWLVAYAAFCVLRDRYSTPDYTMWGEYAVYDAEKVERLCREAADDINYWYFIQYHLDRQMRRVQSYAHSLGVALKGDIPIGISRTSVDAWLTPRLFYLDSQAGAPPDDFSVLGQNWGFPTYNWEEMAKDGFAWWKSRFRKMADYFDAYRIDHILGFFRIWQIPMDALHGLLGFFHPALPFTPEELRESYDFWIHPDTQAAPFIMDWFLGDFFGEYTDEVRERFLIDAGYGRHVLREEVSTQRKIADYFASQPVDDKNTRICNGLLGLVDNVLFVEDPYEKGKYHPRISAQHTYIYRSLSDYEKWSFNRLYNDFYYRRHNGLWYDSAMWKLPPLIDATSMLTCAEDLGMIPDCVPEVMRRLEILSLEIQRMPKDTGMEFGDTRRYPYFSVCTTSTHDMSGIRAWWEEDHERSQRYYNEVMGEHGEAPYYAEPWICDRIVEINLHSPSMLCVLPLQDWMSIDGAIRRENAAEEQINVPANPRHYWRYRMHLTLGELLNADTFNAYLRDIILSSGRK